MLETLIAIKKILLTKNIYQGEISFLNNRNADRLDEVYIKGKFINESDKLSEKEILFKTGESPFYVRELLTNKKIPVIYLNCHKKGEFAYTRNPKFNISRENLPEYCIIFDKWINRFDTCYNLNHYKFEVVNGLLYTYKKEDSKLFEEKGIHKIDNVINDCLSYTNELKNQRKKLEEEYEQNEKIKKVLINSYLKK